MKKLLTVLLLVWSWPAWSQPILRNSLNTNALGTNLVWTPGDNFFTLNGTIANSGAISITSNGFTVVSISPPPGGNLLPGLTVSSLTANTLVQANGTKTLTSVANAAGVLTNDGSGGLSFVASGGGAQVWTNDGNAVSLIGFSNLVRIVHSTPSAFLLFGRTNSTTDTLITLESRTNFSFFSTLYQTNGSAATGFQLFSDATTAELDILFGGSIVTFMVPTSDATDVPYSLGTTKTHTSGGLFELKNNNTNKFVVAVEGQVSLQGRTNLIGDNGTALTYNGTPISGDTTATNIVTLTQTGTNVSALDYALVARGGTFKLQLTNNAYIGAPSGVASTPFSKAWLVVQQPSTGTCFLTFTNGFYQFPEGVAPIIDTNNGAVTIYQFISDPITNGLLHGWMSVKSKLIP